MCVTVIPENPKSGNENKQYKQEWLWDLCNFPLSFIGNVHKLSGMKFVLVELAERIPNIAVHEVPA